MPYKTIEDRKKHSKQYYLKNKEKIIKQIKEYCLNNKEEKKEYDKQIYQNNKEKILEYQKKYYVNNKKERSEYNKKYYQDNKLKLSESTKLWYKNNHDKVNQYKRNKYNVNIKFNIDERISSGMRISLKNNKNGRHWESLVDYSLNDLLKKTMPEGYNWKDFLNSDLHIDHIIPKSAFNFTKPEDIDFKRCWALENLQLLPARENISKNNKLYKPFQPALKI